MLRLLGDKVEDLASRTAAIAVTGQGDGTWLIDRDGEPVAPAWLWLDSRAAAIVEELDRRRRARRDLPPHRLRPERLPAGARSSSG